LEQALRAIARQFQVIVSDRSARVFTDRAGCQVRKVHGTISQPDSLVITRSDYAEFVHDNPYTIEGLRHDLTQYVFLFIGYSLSDPDFNNIYDNVLFTMGRMRQHHYIVVPEINEYETQDLLQRGLRAIDLSLLPGATTNDRLTHLLQQLVESSSEKTHISRFYRGVTRGQRVPLVVTSRLHELEQYVYFPECDLLVAQQVSEALELAGARGIRLADHYALNRRTELLRQDLVVICSPFGNAFARLIFDELESTNSTIPFRWRNDSDGRRYIEIVSTGERYYSDDPTKADGHTEQQDVAIISRIRNPWSSQHFLFMFAGLQALGTTAVATFLSNFMNYQQLPWEQEDVTMLLTITYKEHDPYDYQYDIASIVEIT
jgi:hypothetical protein